MDLTVYTWYIYTRGVPKVHGLREYGVVTCVRDCNARCVYDDMRGEPTNCN